MAWWAWIGCVAMVALGSRQLWRAFTLGKVYARYAYFTRSDSPVTFWLLVGFYFFGVVLFGGGILLVAAKGMGLI